MAEHSWTKNCKKYTKKETKITTKGLDMDWKYTLKRKRKKCRLRGRRSCYHFEEFYHRGDNIQGPIDQSLVSPNPGLKFNPLF